MNSPMLVRAVWALATIFLAGCYQREEVCVGGVCEDPADQEGDADVCAVPEIAGVVENDEPVAGTLRGEANPVFVGDTGAAIGDDLVFVGDMDGDGSAELAMSDREYERVEPEDEHQRGVVYLVYGRDDFCAEQSLGGEVMLEGDDLSADHSLEVAAAGDLDADGYADLLVGDQNGIVCIFEDLSGEYGEEAAHGRVYVIYGGPRREGVQELHEAGSMIRDETPCSSAGEAVAGLGDLDADGYDDFALTANTAWSDGDDPGLGRVHVFYGGPDRLAPEGSLGSGEAVLRSDGAMRFGASISALGDVDGDGFADFGVTDEARVWLIHGAAARLAGEVAIADVAISIDEAGQWPIAAGVGDLDEDGLDDFAVAIEANRRIEGDDRDAVDASVHLFYGAPARLSQGLVIQDSDAVIEGSSSAWSRSSVAGVGDFDGDGLPDFLVGDPSLQAGAGGAYLIRGDRTRLADSQPIEALSTPWLGMTRVLVTDAEDDGREYERRQEFQDRAGWAISGGGDLDGDGHADLAVGASTDTVNGDLGGRVYLLRGR